MIFCFETPELSENLLKKAIYKVWERKLELVWLFTKCGSENWSSFAIYKVWELKLELDWLFTRCGSENWSLIGYLQSVGAKMQLCFAIYKVWERKLELVWQFPFVTICRCSIVCWSRMFVRRTSVRIPEITLKFTNCFKIDY